MMEKLKQNADLEEITAITNIRIFDGYQIIAPRHIVIKGVSIISVGGDIPSDATIIDGENATLIPGLIDAHVHTSIGGLRDALKFGVTTELEMNGDFTKRGREIQLKMSMTLQTSDLLVRRLPLLVGTQMNCCLMEMKYLNSY